MANEEQIAMLKRSVEEWNQWREGNPGLTPELRGAGLSDAQLNRAGLTRSVRKLGASQGEEAPRLT